MSKLETLRRNLKCEISGLERKVSLRDGLMIEFLPGRACQWAGGFYQNMASRASKK